MVRAAMIDQHKVGGSVSCFFTQVALSPKKQMNVSFLLVNRHEDIDVVMVREWMRNKNNPKRLQRFLGKR